MELLDDTVASDFNNQVFDFRHQETTKTLGLRWNPHDDQFSFQVQIPTNSCQPTKRSLLSDISKIFDPLGWLTPVTVSLKLLFQESWLLDLQWDDVLPKDFAIKWQNTQRNLEQINAIRVQRWLTSHENCDIELHGFCDSSTKAYASVIYCKVKSTDESRKNNSSVVIVAGKSRLVPTKKTVTLPRLELCAAHLLSKLMKTVKDSLSDYNIKVFGWSDSTAVLGWLNGNPDRWKPFVANRVKQITEIMPPECWAWVESSLNPADCASRGITADQLLKHSTWWTGPYWLPSYDGKASQERPNYVTDKEIKRSIQINVVTKDNENDTIRSLIHNYSNFTRVTRILAWILRLGSINQNKPPFLTITELRKAKHILIKYVQRTSFSDDIQYIEKFNHVSNKSKLLKFKPFIDQDGLLRVGGRIRHANIDEKMKHPLILPHNHHLTDMLIDQGHKMTFHGGTRMTLAWLRQQYWILGGNNAVKKKLRNCVTCRRHDPIKENQLMGDLPSARTNASRPFFHTGVDFTGFVDVKSSKGRGIATTKGYVAVFVCMATKAVHLELVSDLTASAFLAAFRRLAARRGAPRHVYSDNGSNFVKANRRLQEEMVDLKATLDDNFYTELTKMDIEWHFNAPSWPSAGGLWESAVKILKRHLRRVIGEQKLTYEEYSTLLAQLEGCLNSRPLCALSEDPEDIDYLTPSHFLSSGPILTIIESERDERTRWQLTQKIYQDIWKRWRSEYLAQITARSKWQKPKRNMEIDDIVLIHDANLPAGKWAIGRVVQLHPGKDGYVRVVTVKTKNGTMKRPVVKLSILPTTNQSNQNSQTSQQPSNENINVSSNNNNSDSKPQGKRSTRKGAYYYITLALMLFMLIFSPAQCAHTYNKSSLNSNQSIYFDKISNMHFIRDQWKLIVYYDMEPYWQGSNLFVKYLNHLESLCMNKEIKTHCNIILLQMHHGYTELEHNNKALLGQQFPPGRVRVTRGLINVVGNVAHSLFGVLDDQFAEQYNKDINLIRSNQKHLALLWKNQTSVVESEYNFLKRFEIGMEKQHKVFNQHLNNLENSANIMNEEIMGIETTNEFILSSITANNILMNLKSIQDTLLNTITNIYHGKFNIHLLKPEQLLNELNIISGQLSKDLCLPINNLQADLPKIYNLLKVKAKMTNEYFIFEIRIPLVSRDIYEIYRMIPIPQKYGNSMVTLAPIASYIAMNVPKDLYVPMTDIDIQQCTQFDDDTQLCPLQKPTYQMKSDQSLCLKDSELQRCRTNSVPCISTWTQLAKVNTYLYFCCDRCPIKIICGHLITTDRLSKAGIASLGEDCLIKGDDITIISHKIYTNDLHLQADVMNIEMPPINNIVNLTISLNETELGTISGHEQDLKDLDKQIKEMKSETGLQQQFSSHDVHHYVAIYVLMFAVGAGAAVYAVRRIRKRCVVSSHLAATAGASASEPAPRPAPTTNEVAYSDQCVSVNVTPNSDYARVQKVPRVRIDKANSPISYRVNH